MCTEVQGVCCLLQFYNFVDVVEFLVKMFIIRRIAFNCEDLYRNILYGYMGRVTPK